MSAASSTNQIGGSAVSQPGVACLSYGIRERVADYAELCRPRIAVMTLVAVATGFTLASPITFNWSVLFPTLIGIVQLVAASSILNQLLERRTDAAMLRTSDRPIASGRISVMEAALVSLWLSACGLAMLWNLVNLPTAVGTLATLLIYVFGYTLLKTRSSLCTTVGAIPGAMPPVLGWLAAGGSLGIEALALFALFFVWQFPHFLAIGWIHRDDYRRAGLRMLPSYSDQGWLTAVIACVYAAAFVPVSVLPSYAGLAGDVYFVIASLCSVSYLLSSICFLRHRTTQRARQLLYTSLICLPCLLGAMVADFLRLTSMG